MIPQHDLFLKEGDNWFKRNKDNFSKKDDGRIIDIIKANNLKAIKVLDIGCCFGYLLNKIRNECGVKECYGVEPSSKAIKYGQEKYPFLKIKQGFAHELNYKDNYFDWVIISFVFHWIDRDTLLASISEIDRVLKDSGHIIIQDFAPKYCYKTKYHHLEGIYTYKQNYWDIFEVSNLYSIIYEKEFLRHKNEILNNKNLCKIAVLQKRQQSNYLII